MFRFGMSSNYRNADELEYTLEISFEKLILAVLGGTGVEKSFNRILR